MRIRCDIWAFQVENIQEKKGNTFFYMENPEFHKLNFLRASRKLVQEKEKDSGWNEKERNIRRPGQPEREEKSGLNELLLYYSYARLTLLSFIL